MLLFGSFKVRGGKLVLKHGIIEADMKAGEKLMMFE